MCYHQAAAAAAILLFEQKHSEVLHCSSICVMYKMDNMYCFSLTRFFVCVTVVSHILKVLDAVAYTILTQAKLDILKHIAYTLQT